MDKIEEIRKRVEERQGKQFFMAEPEAFAWDSVQWLLSEVDRLNCKLQDERKECSEEYARLRATYVGKAKELTAQVDWLNKENAAKSILLLQHEADLSHWKERAEAAEARADAAMEDIYTAYSDGLCEVCGRRDTCTMMLDRGEDGTVCYGLKFEWRGPQDAGKGEAE